MSDDDGSEMQTSAAAVTAVAVAATAPANGAKSSDDDRKVFAGGLPQEATEADIKEYFATFGEVASVNLKMDPVTGRSRGFAFIVFETEDMLTGILAQEHAIKGKKVAVKKAASKQGKIYVGKFTDITITDEVIKEHFGQYGNVVEMQRPVDRSKNEAKNFCFITFDKEEPAEMLLKKSSVNVAGQEVTIKKVAVKDGNGGPMGGGGGRGGFQRGGMRGGGGRTGIYYVNFFAYFLKSFFRM
jgi:squid-like protein